MNLDLVLRLYEREFERKVRLVSEVLMVERVIN